MHLGNVGGCTPTGWILPPTEGVSRAAGGPEGWSELLAAATCDRERDSDWKEAKECGEGSDDRWNDPVEGDSRLA